MGTGEYSYEFVWPFVRPPAGTQLGFVSNVAVDSRGRVYAYQRREPPVVVFDRDGAPLGTWGEGEIYEAHGIYITRSDEVFLVDRGAHQVLKFSVEGECLLRMGERERPSLQAPFNHPTDVAVSPEGEIYVSDGYGNASVHRFSPEGEHLLSWGAPGGGPGEFSTPHGIWVDGRGRVYVVDRENNRVQVFDHEGSYLGEWRGLYHPMDIYMDAEGVFYVTDQTPRLSVLDPEGRILSRGYVPEGHGIWGDSRGDLYIAGEQRGVAKLVRQ